MSTVPPPEPSTTLASSSMLTLNDGHTIPQLGFGVWQITGRDTVPAVTAALAAGYRHIDTAAAYGNEAGVGRALRESGLPREQVYVTTKLDNHRHYDARAALEESVQALGQDHVDLYLIHWPVPRTNAYLRVWEQLQQAQADGLARSIGVSNFTAPYLRAVIDAGGVVPAVNQVECHPTYQQRELQALNTAHGVITEAYSPLGMGRELRSDVVTGIAERRGATPAQMVLAWHLAAGRVVIPKSATPARIMENHAALGVELTGEDVAALDALEAGQLLGWDPDHV